MTDNHPIKPSPMLVHKWATMFESHTDEEVFTEVARWGSDTELEACCEWLDDTDCEDPQEVAQRLRAARRPKPPTLKEQALEVLSLTQKGWGLAQVDLDTIRRALEALPND